jgi:MFS family permease
MGWIADRYGAKKVIALGLALSTVVAGIYGFAGDWWMLIPAIILSQIAMRMLMPLADVIFVGTAKPEQRATAMGFSRTIMGIPGILAPTMAAVIVASSGGINAQGIRPLYYIQLVFTAVVFLFLILKLPSSPRKVDPKKDTAGSKETGFIQDFRDLFKGEKWLKRWIILMSIRNFGIRIAMPFIPLWIVNVKGADPYILGIMGTLGTIIGVLLQIPVGRLSDTIGRKKVYFLLRPISYVGTALLILAPSPEYLFLVGLLGVGLMGGIGGVSFTTFITMHYEMVPKEKMGRWYGINGILNIISFPASLLGGYLWQQGFMIEVLVLPLVLEALFVIPILITVPDTLGRNTR